jgi:NAD(P)-dependent dehydrogenase (short-subunit alcohol dehydrogenase family)
MARFDGKVALITGGGAGIGRATATLLVEEGAQVAILDRDGEAALSVAAELGEERVLGIAADVTSQEEVAAAVERTVREWGRIDLLHNQAGVLPAGDGSVLDIDIATMRSALEVNVVGQVVVAQAVGREMARHGAGVIVNTASDLSFIALPGVCSYVTSKTAILGLTRSMAADLAAHGIRVNAVCPGFVSTSMTAPLEADTGLMTEMRKDYLIPSLGQPRDVAGVVAFLMSEDARYMTGSCLLVDGGHTVR